MSKPEQKICTIMKYLEAREWRNANHHFLSGDPKQGEFHKARSEFAAAMRQLIEQKGLEESFDVAFAALRRGV